MAEFCLSYEHYDPRDNEVYHLLCIGKEDRDQMRSIIEDRGHMVLMDAKVSSLPDEARTPLEEDGRITPPLTRIARRRSRERARRDDFQPDEELPF